MARLIQPEHCWLNVGSGTHYEEGWTNIDSDDWHGSHPDSPQAPDYLLDVMDLPKTFQPRSFSKVYLGHVLEHVPLAALPRFLLAIEMVCVPGAWIGVVGPCIEKALNIDINHPLARAIVAYDPPKPPPGEHAWTSTTAFTLHLLHSYGMWAEETDLEVLAKDFPVQQPDALWQFGIAASFLEHRSPPQRR